MAYDIALAALADRTRRGVFEQLRSGPLPVGEIANRLPVSRPAVSQHLKVLKEAGLVVDRAEGTRRVYYIDPHGLAALRRWLDGFWDDALAAFAEDAAKLAAAAKDTGKKANVSHARSRTRTKSRSRSARSRSRV